MQLSSRLRGSDVTEARVAIASAALAERAPHWLHASEIIEPDDPPADAVELQSVLSLRPNQLELAIAQAKQKVDARRREEIGAAGEAGLASWIEANGLPVSHVSLDDDTLGYDLVVQAGGTSWHVEVKSSTQPSFRGVYLSRHELEVSRLDPRWLLVLVALDGALKLQGVRTVTESDLAIVAPRDHHPSASWMSARFTIPGADLVPGLRLGDSTLTFT